MKAKQSRMEPGCAALFALLLLCHSSVTAGEPTTSTTLSTSVPGNPTSGEPKPHSESTTNLIASSEGHASLSQNLNGTKSSTEAPASPETTAGNVSNATSATGNVTGSQNATPGDNQTLSTQTTSTTSFVPMTSAPKADTVVSTSVVPKTTWTSSASIRPLNSTSTASGTTSSVVTTPQTRRRFTTAVVKGTSASSTGRTTESTAVLNKSRVDSPSELNVGDDEHTSSMDPLLVGLVSVFVVTAAAISLLIFLRFRHKNEQPEFRRLQDLPMDDMMEDTPLSMYSY